MKTSTVATRYAKALLQLAQERKTLPLVLTQASTLRDALDGIDLTQPFTKARRMALASAMAKAVGAHALLANTLGVLASNNRLADIPAVLQRLQDLADKAAHVVRVNVSSPTPLTSTQKAELTALVKRLTHATEAPLVETHDASLIGGLKAMFGGMLWDASIRGQLNRLKSHLATTKSN